MVYQDIVGTGTQMLGSRQKTLVGLRGVEGGKM